MTYLDQIAQLDAARTQGLGPEAPLRGEDDDRFFITGLPTDYDGCLSKEDAAWIAAASTFIPWAVRMLREAGELLSDNPDFNLDKVNAWLAALEKGPDGGEDAVSDFETASTCADPDPSKPLHGTALCITTEEVRDNPVEVIAERIHFMAEEAEKSLLDFALRLKVKLDQPPTQQHSGGEGYL